MTVLDTVLQDKHNNYIFPFFWLRGEDEATLREYMKIIDESNIKAVCIESRPHPDFCGPKWWHDMDILLDEAQKRNMKIWILDDSHFPTGYANGAMATQPDELCRQSICCRITDCDSSSPIFINKEQLLHPDPFTPTPMEQILCDKNPRHYDDDRLIGLYAVKQEACSSSTVNLMPLIKNDCLEWNPPQGSWKLYTLHLSRNMGYHRSYINMMSYPSCRVLIDAVYEPHLAHYEKYFGNTIAGFFSDEPELGNGHLYAADTLLGSSVDFPWSMELETYLKNILGEDYILQLHLLWENDSDAQQTAMMRYTYMNAVTTLVKKDFSIQIGEWCRAHGVQYIGHLIEDNNQHTQTGSSLGHYFRGLAGQDMAGIDNIGGQVIPQAENMNVSGQVFGNRDGEFYHYMLGKLANSAAAIEPLKMGNAMCEIFGAYGWSEGVRLEKYLIDHFLVRGINHYVPHAFSAAPYPDPDCPPHFYAHGNNPQYRHFGALMKYTNRMCELISNGHHIAPVAILYHSEGAWTGSYMGAQKPAHHLADAQIDYDFIPQDVFEYPDYFGTKIADGKLTVSTQEYRSFLIPETQFITRTFALALIQMLKCGVPVYIIGKYPEGICDGSPTDYRLLLDYIQKAKQITLENLVSVLEKDNLPEIYITPANNRIRYHHYEHRDGTGFLLFVNEGTDTYIGNIAFQDTRNLSCYDGWENTISPLNYDGNSFPLIIEPLKCVVVALTREPVENTKTLSSKHFQQGVSISLPNVWTRSICRSIDYPQFSKQAVVFLPDHLAQEEPDFSGFVRYVNTFNVQAVGHYLLCITDAHEGVEVFVNGLSLGIQIVPAFEYDITPAIRLGENELIIEVATTLERENAKNPDPYGAQIKASALSGITGTVEIYYTA